MRISYCFVRIVGQPRNTLFPEGYMNIVIAWVNLKRYEYTCSEDRLEYYFESVGPKGVIRKVVKFAQYRRAKQVYNLEFGDVDPLTGIHDDSIKSNNGDRDVVMATVAAIVLEFATTYPNKLVFAEGFDRARTRLYQMAIASHFAEISLMFHVNSYIDGAWQPFKINTNYECFYIEHKYL